MARIQPTQGPDNGDTAGEGRAPGRHKAMRYAVPVAVAGVAAATISLVPALADSGNPKLPKISAEELLTKIASSDTRTLSGSVKISTDFGLPSFLAGGLGGLGGGGGPFAGGNGGHQGKDGQDGNGGKGGSSAADPKTRLTELLAGTHTLHVASDGPDRQRVSVVENAAEYSLIHNGDQVWAYDSQSNEVYHATRPQDGRKAGGKDGKSGLKDGKSGRDLPKDLPTTPREAARQALGAVDATTSVTVDGTAKVAGRDAYQLLIQPKQGDSTVGSIRVAVDSATGVPLKFTLTPKGGGKAAIDIGFTKVDFGTPSAGTFNFTPPKGAKVTEADPAAGHKDTVNRHDAASPLSGSGLTVLGQGWSSIAEIKAPKDSPGEERKGWHGAPGGNSDAQSLLDSFGKHVTGTFGSGTVYTTRLVNALITDKGTVFVGAVSQDALVRAANAAK